MHNRSRILVVAMSAVMLLMSAPAAFADVGSVSNSVIGIAHDGGRHVGSVSNSVIGIAHDGGRHVGSVSNTVVGIAH
jgi:hypothetical protein